VRIVLDVPRYQWQYLQPQDSVAYDCGYCGNRVGPNIGWNTQVIPSVRIVICSHCEQPTYFDEEGTQWPGPTPGTPVQALPPEVEAIYNEARRSMSVAAPNTSVMACRKLLMHIAAERGAGEDRTFKQYVEWLVQNHYVPPGGEGWADHIRGKGNEANHEIDLIDTHTAEQVLAFTEFLLRFVYELPARAGPQGPPGGQANPADGGGNTN
jgi:hypothetical protein